MHLICHIHSSLILPLPEKHISWDDAEFIFRFIQMSRIFGNIWNFIWKEHFLLLYLLLTPENSIQTKQDVTLYQAILFIQQAPSECLLSVWYILHPHDQGWRHTRNQVSVTEACCGGRVGRKWVMAAHCLEAGGGLWEARGAGAELSQESRTRSCWIKTRITARGDSTRTCGADLGTRDLTQDGQTMTHRPAASHPFQ